MPIALHSMKMYAFSQIIRSLFALVFMKILHQMSQDWLKLHQMSQEMTSTSLSRLASNVIGSCCQCHTMLCSREALTSWNTCQMRQDVVQEWLSRVALQMTP